MRPHPYDSTMLVQVSDCMMIAALCCCIATGKVEDVQQDNNRTNKAI